MEATQINYRLLLRNELERRCRNNPRYSLRAFARDIAVSAPRLSHVLKGDHGLSPEAARAIAKRLNWNTEEQELFCELVTSEHSRSKKRRFAAQARANEYAKNYKTLEMDAFRIVSDWYHFAILELTNLKKFRSDHKWIAKTLGISVHEASAAIDRLLKLEALEKVGNQLRAKADFQINRAGVPSEAVRSFHRQILTKAILALETQSTNKRDSTCAIMAINENDFPRAKALLEEFRLRFDSEFCLNKTNKTHVYALSLQLFRLNEGEE